MELEELSGRTAGRLGYTGPTTAYAIGGGTATILLSSPQLPPDPFTVSGDQGPDGPVGA
jgi:hypothetical protein